MLTFNQDDLHPSVSIKCQNLLLETGLAPTSRSRTHNQRVSFDIDVIYTRHTFLNNILLRPSSVKSP
jgi:hypothetical protein